MQSRACGASSSLRHKGTSRLCLRAMEENLHWSPSPFPSRLLSVAHRNNYGHRRTWHPSSMPPRRSYGRPPAGRGRLQYGRSRPDTQCRTDMTATWHQLVNEGENASVSGPSDARPTSTVERPGRAPMQAPDVSTQREKLVEELSEGSYECMVCCEKVRAIHAIWNCQNCYNIFHLTCVTKWAQSSTDETVVGWRCPGCQNVCDKTSLKYFCYCGKTRNPEWNRYDVPHSCGEQCKRRRRQQHDCIHLCNLQCHPGPCPPCGTYVERTCFCQKVHQRIRCGQFVPFSCGEVCDKLLACGKHRCTHQCHAGDCKACGFKVKQSCFCHEKVRHTHCSVDVEANSQFSCGAICDRLLDCGKHTCQSLCHRNACEPCKQGPEEVTHCPCGQTQLVEVGAPMRTSCTDPIPTCNKTCGKLLPCGAPGDRHRCRSKCHVGPCGACSVTLTVVCRCKSSAKKMSCSKSQKGAAARCEKKCNRWRSCGRHKCQKKCCNDGEHLCTLPCSRWLLCARHKCDQFCHAGDCPPCENTSFNELTCHCGASILFPPIACGTKPPMCNKPCIRPQPCGHPVSHACHSDARCPPCTVLVEKWCYGKHELRASIPCHRQEVSCGLACDKTLPCGQHKCKRICHAGKCMEKGVGCNQLCTKARPRCGHPCGVVCHVGRDCPPGRCGAQVTATCKCGRRSKTVACTDQTLPKLTATEVNMFGLNCDSQCALIERNKRFAMALKLHDVDFTNNLGPPPYSDFLKDQTRRNQAFVASAYDKLVELVESTSKSEQRSRSHAFPPMKREQRRVVHELAEFFGCRTQSYDEEPKKNVTATAFRGKASLPSVSIVAVVKNETAARKPLVKTAPLQPLSASSVAEPLQSVAARAFGERPRNAWADRRHDVIDYFDYVNPTNP